MDEVVAEDALSVAHVLARLGVIERLVLDELHRRRSIEADHDDWRLRGVYVDDEAVDRLLSRPPGGSPVVAASVAEELEEIEAEAAEIEAEGGRLRLRQLAAHAGLDPVDVQLLLLAAASALDPRFELVFGYLNDDVTLRRPTVGLALELAGLSGLSAEARQRLDPAGCLARQGLVVVHEDQSRPPMGWTVSAHPRVVSFLLDGDEPAEGVRDVLVPTPPLPGPSADRIAALLGATAVPLVHVVDTTLVTGTSSAVAAVEQRGREALVLDAGRLTPGRRSAAATDAVVEAVVTGAVLVVDGVDGLAAAAPEALAVLTRGTVPVVFVGTSSWDPSWSRSLPAAVTAEVPSRASLGDVWRQALGDDGDALDVDRSLTALRVSPAQVARAVDGARLHARAEGRAITVTDVQAGVRQQNATGLQRLARRVEPSAGWADLVVSQPVEEELQLIALRWRNRDLVLGDWGLAGGAGRGRGVSALFAGPSGTGKTLAAQVIAGDLGLDLYIVDLSTVVDKYIGETSKNLDRIFDQADRVNGVLLFDEADALFGKRSSVKDSKDRNANMEVAYLLQRMEAFDGVAILTTNLASNLDDAFLRRLDAIVDFPRPDAGLRRGLWEVALGADVPRADDVDLEVLAERFRLSGGEIRNVALAACYWAAERGTEVTMQDLHRAAVREHRKLQKRLSRTELGPYAGLLDG